MSADEIDDDDSGLSMVRLVLEQNNGDDDGVDIVVISGLRRR